ncbi:TIGR01212 family radical SAM protein [Candidatus Latescibacterota bacterium]
MSKLPYTDLNTSLRALFGERVQKITVDAGFTCPNRDNTLSSGGCIYCSSRGSGNGMYPEKSITEQLESAKEFLGRRYKAKKFIAYFQSFSNTYAPVETLRELYEEALAVEDIVGLAIGTRPDCVQENVLDLITELAEKTYISMEYGLQSIHDKTLKLINRGHTYEDFKDAVSRTRARGIQVCAHVILGLPGESKEDMLAAAGALRELGVQAVKIHLLYVIKGTALHEMYERGDFKCLTREEYTDIVCDFLALLPREIIIHRLTGDPHPEELAAPFWALEKDANINAIRDNLRRKNIWQGKLSL